MDAPARLGFGHPLHPVDAAFKFQATVGTLAGDHKADLLIAAQLGFIDARHLGAVTPALGVHGVHPEQAVGEQSAFLAAHAPTNFHDDVLAVVGGLGQQKHLQFPV